MIQPQCGDVRLPEPELNEDPLDLRGSPNTATGATGRICWHVGRPGVTTRFRQAQGAGLRRARLDARRSSAGDVLVRAGNGQDTRG
jgi:hypothetical protein